MIALDERLMQYNVNAGYQCSDSRDTIRWVLLSGRRLRYYDWAIMPIAECRVPELSWRPDLKMLDIAICQST